MADHEFYKALCARAAFGDVSPEELAALKQHLATCGSCGAVAKDFGQIASQVVLQVVDDRDREDVSFEGKRRFYRVAQEQGINLSDPLSAPPRQAFPLTKLSIVALAVAMLIGGGGLARAFFRRGVEVPSRDASAAIPVVNPESSGSEEKDGNKIQSLQSQVQTLRGTVEHANRKISELEKASAADQNEQRTLKSEIAILESSGGVLRNEINGKNIENARLQHDVEELQATNLTLSQLGKQEENQLRQQIAQLNEQIERGVSVSSAQQLLAARNLHIVDVHDTDEQGHGQRAFGRIFYVEGKELIFYAYDLSAALVAKKDFCVWGERLGFSKSIKRLGTLRADDLGAGRWILRETDPKLLSKIDSVFVTVEPSKRTITEPSGKKVLYAYLGNKPNHP